MVPLERHELPAALRGMRGMGRAGRDGDTQAGAGSGQCWIIDLDRRESPHLEFPDLRFNWHVRPQQMDVSLPRSQSPAEFREFAHQDDLTGDGHQPRGKGPDWLGLETADVGWRIGEPPDREVNQGAREVEGRDQHRVRKFTITQQCRVGWSQCLPEVRGDIARRIEFNERRDGQPGSLEMSGTDAGCQSALGVAE